MGYKAIPLIWQIFIGRNHWPYIRESLYIFRADAAGTPEVTKHERKRARVTAAAACGRSPSLPPSRDLSVRDVTLAKVFLPNFLIAWERATD